VLALHREILLANETDEDYLWLAGYRTCAIIGGVLTIASLIDSFVFTATGKLKERSAGAASTNVNGYGGGKIM
jgi:hypothetical protein